MTIALLSLIVLVAFAIETAAGFGSTLVALTLGAHLYPVETLLAALLPVNLPLSAYVVFRHWNAVDRRLLGTRILPLMGLGMAAGVLAIEAAGAAWLKLAFAIFVVALSAIELRAILSAERATRGLPAIAGVGALVAGGLVHGLFACGGPLVVYVTNRTLDDKARVRSTLSALWLVLNLVLVARYAVGGQITPESLKLSGILIAPLLLGIVGGEWLHGRLSERTFRLGVFALLLVAGAVLLVSSWGHR